MAKPKAQAGRLGRILEISRELSSTMRVEPLLHKIVGAAAELTDSEVASLLLLDEKTGELRFRVARGDPKGQLRDIPVPVEGSIAGSVPKWTLCMIASFPAVQLSLVSTDNHIAPSAGLGK